MLGEKALSGKTSCPRQGTTKGRGPSTMGKLVRGKFMTSGTDGQREVGVACKVHGCTGDGLWELVGA